MTDIPIFTKAYELYKTFYSFLQSFPKKDRYIIGKRCEELLLELLESTINAGNLPKDKKLPVLKEASLKVDLLKVLFRLLRELKVIDNKKYLVLEEYLQEIGKMLGGWIKSLEM